jgi:hypothetical protein
MPNKTQTNWPQREFWDSKGKVGGDSRESAGENRIKGNEEFRGSSECILGARRNKQKQGPKNTTEPAWDPKSTHTKFVIGGLWLVWYNLLCNLFLKVD